MQAHQAYLSIIADEDADGHGIIDGDHTGQRLSPYCWHGHQLSGVLDSWWNMVLRLSRWRVENYLGLGFEHNVVDGIDVER
jgi:hypothetical protein